MSLKIKAIHQTQRTEGLLAELAFEITLGLITELNYPFFNQTLIHRGVLVHRCHVKFDVVREG